MPGGIEVVNIVVILWTWKQALAKIEEQKQKALEDVHESKWIYETQGMDRPATSRDP